MLVTSKEANKLLNQLEVKHDDLLRKEKEIRTFLAAVGEDVESCRTKYDYKETQKELSDIEDKIRKVKHQINQFNITTKVDEFNMTIDELLVYIPQLTRRKRKLEEMKAILPKCREAFNMRSTIIDYRYANYDVEKASKDYDEVLEELTKAQIALDTVNINNQFEIEL